MVALATYLIGVRALGRTIALTISIAGALSFIIVGNGTIAIAILAVTAILRLRGLRVAQDRTEVRSILFQVGLVTAGFMVYELGRIHTVGSYATAAANAERIVDAERSLGLLFESGLQSAVLQADWVTRAFNFTYSYSFLAFIFGALSRVGECRSDRRPPRARPCWGSCPCSRRRRR